MKPKIDSEAQLNVLRSMWRQLHRYAFECALFPDQAQDRATFFAQWEAQFPPDCPCRDFWREHVKLFPIPADANAFFWWTIHTHDFVNKQLGKIVWHPTSKHSEMLTHEPL